MFRVLNSAGHCWEIDRPRNTVCLMDGMYLTRWGDAFSPGDAAHWCVAFSNLPPPPPAWTHPAESVSHGAIQRPQCSSVSLSWEQWTRNGTALRMFSSCKEQLRLFSFHRLGVFTKQLPGTEGTVCWPWGALRGHCQNLGLFFPWNVGDWWRGSQGERVGETLPTRRIHFH